MSDTISRPDGASAVHFKDEDVTDDGMPIGPVYFIVETDEGKTYVPAFTYDEVDFLVNPAAGWMTSSEARRMAKHFDLPFEAV